MPKQPKPTNPPIKDINNNGYLDGEDLRKQLNAEEQSGQTRSPIEKVHGVLEMSDIRKLTKLFSQKAIDADQKGGAVHYKDLEEAAITLKSFMENTMSDLQRDQKNFPTKESLMTAMRASRIQQGFKGERLEISMADASNMYDFAQTLKQTFPKGIKIDASDMPELMAHFGELVVPPSLLKEVEQHQAKSKTPPRK